MRLAAVLEAGRRDFIDAIQGITPEEASAKPIPNCWSVLECIEHVAAVEERYLKWILDGTALARQPDSENELRLFALMRSRLTKVEAPSVVRPRGRFRTLEDALAAFMAVRDRSVQVAEERGDALYSVGMKHPFFGEVNGVEMVQLIDGHARRHADQIRELREACAAPQKARSKPAKAKKEVAFRRDEPDLPDELESLTEPDRLFADRELVSIEGMHVRELQRRDLRVNNLRVQGSVLDRVQLGGGELSAAVWKDVRLVGCDLANVRVHRMTMVRVELVDCRLSGLSATALDWQDVLIQNGDVRYAQFQGGRFRSCEFDRCNWQDADLQNADLAGSIFRSCDLGRADFNGTTLQNTDFRGSQVEGMLVGVKDLRGAIVDPAQAMVLARVLGLQIR